MLQQDLIDAREFCTYHNIEISFLKSLKELQLLHLNETEERLSFPSVELPVVEKIIRFHYELEINLQGIQTISHLLQKIESLQQENNILKNRLQLYEL